jgi:chromosome segregation ATPase
LRNCGKGEFVDKKTIGIFLLAALAALFLFLFIVKLDDVKRAQGIIAKAEEDKKNLSAELDKLRGQNKIFTEQIGTLNGQMSTLNTEKQTLLDQLTASDKDQESLQAEIRRLNDELVKARSAVMESQKQTQRQPAVQEAPAALPMTAQPNEYWALVLKQKAQLEMKLEEISRQCNEAKLTAGKLQQEKTEIDQDVKTLTRENQDLTRELEYNKKMLDSLTLNLAVEKSDNYETKSTQGSLKSENKKLLARLKAVEKRKETLEETLAELKEKNAVLETGLEKMQAFVKQKLQQVDALKEDLPLALSAAKETQKAAQQPKGSVDLPPIVIRPDGAQKQEEARVDLPVRGETRQKSAANIIAVNKENNFVIMSHGSGYGVKIGDRLTVYDDGGSVAGEVEVIQVRESIAAADIKKEIQPLRAGFTVR